jgi:membrane protease YdiL (CAAX protease family)
MNPSFQRFYTNWANLPPVRFVIVTTLLSIFLTLPFFVLLTLAGVEPGDIRTPDIRTLGIVKATLYAVLLAPLLETVIGQLLPILLVQKFVRWKSNTVAILVSTILFSAAHATHSIYYPVVIAPTAFLLALTYIVFQQRKESSFWMTFFVHAFKNLLAVMVAFTVLSPV